MVVTSGGGCPATVSAILLAAGKGERLGGVEKAFLQQSDGQSLLESDIDRLRDIAGQIVVGIAPEVSPPDMLKDRPDITWTVGGSCRLDTLRNALDAVTGEIVLIWDVARPCVPIGMVRDLLASAAEHGAAMPVLRFRTRESLGIEVGGWLATTFPREGLFLSQTPQAYRAEILKDSLAHAEHLNTREISIHAIVKASGYPVRIIEGSKDNRKLTFPEDLQQFLTWLQSADSSL
jgi:2-C-methyl-D-erythritol 4-phosphate cytidylyltransferase